MSYAGGGLSPFALAGLLTHLVVFVAGLGGLIGIVPLQRGRRAGLGLTLMALAMAIVLLQPRLHLGLPAAGAYAVLFLIALWLLIGPTSGKRERRPQSLR